jgi:Lrp/AsnC family leucine-responsive transcriptional regulator
MTGLTNAMVIVKSKTRKELSEFVIGVLTIPFVERTNTHVVLTSVKDDYRGVIE